ncbi:hypothetical protein [Kitasatospora indigofera]|uniref:hypothetical protein n=1 Tax=Kitasatospora indigofera TaxID=67307 RepID=UPI0036C5E917
MPTHHKITQLLRRLRRTTTPTTAPTNSTAPITPAAKAAVPAARRGSDLADAAARGTASGISRAVTTWLLDRWSD